MFVLAAPPIPQIPPIVLVATAPRDPRFAGLDLEGWDMVQLAGGVLTLSHGALGDQIPNLPEVWIRSEPIGVRAPSSLERVQFDCAAHRMRVMEAYSYARRDLEGQRRTLVLRHEAWRPLPDGLMAQPIFTTACLQ